MTHQEAKKLVKERAGSKYADGALRLLEHMVSGLYRKNKENEPIENVRVTREVQRLCLWSGVQKRQLFTVLKSLEEVEIVSRKNGKITYVLHLEPITELPKTASLVKDRIYRTNAGRANTARAKRAELRNQKVNTLATCIAVAVASGMVPNPWQLKADPQIVMEQELTAAAQ